MAVHLLFSHSWKLFVMSKCQWCKMHLCGLMISSCHFIEQHALAMIWPNANKHNTTITLTCLVSIMQLWVWWYTLNKGKENDLHLGQSQNWHIPWCILMKMWRHTLCCRPWHWSSHRVHTARGVREHGWRVGGMQGRRGGGGGMCSVRRWKDTMWKR